MPVDDRPVTLDQVRRGCGPIAGFLDYIRWCATDEAARGAVVTAAQLWAFYDEHVRSCVDPQQAADDLGLPISPDW